MAAYRAALQFELQLRSQLGRAKEESSALEKMDVGRTANEKQYLEFMRLHAKPLSESATLLHHASQDAEALQG